MAWQWYLVLGVLLKLSGEKRLYGSWKDIKVDGVLVATMELHRKAKKKQKHSWAIERNKVLMILVKTLIQLCLRQTTAGLFKFYELINSFSLFKAACIRLLFMMTQSFLINIYHLSCIQCCLFICFLHIQIIYTN